ncbi:MAG: DUF1385 domain-containing protein [Armatimonadetes bacterium]|nr:DUF1385 domain-containing protein [Armatimonadota bacterium]
MDTMRRAASLMRASDGSRILVISNGAILGTVSERAITAALARAEDGDGVLESSVESLMEPGIEFLNHGSSLRGAAATFAANDVDMLPVIDNFGAYRGVLYRRDVVGYLTRNLRPPTPAGMATPLGVYLTTGSVIGGVGDLGLFLTGVSLSLMTIIAGVIVYGLEGLFARLTGIPLRAFLQSPSISTPNLLDVPFFISTALTIVIFGMLMRLSPLAGYHAAEHMTVHAIEAGEVLTPDAVRRMPRVHPRCGTNLLAAVGIFTIITERLGTGFGTLTALVVVVLGWRTVGGWLQYFVTTKDPSERQLANGVAAGNQLIERYQERPNFHLTGFDRIWRMGFVQTLSGMTAVSGLLWLLRGYLRIPGLF